MRPPLFISDAGVAEFPVRRRRQVSKEEGAALAASWGSTAFLETSARTGENVQRVFEQIVVQIEAELNPAPAPAQKGGCVLM